MDIKKLRAEIRKVLRKSSVLEMVKIRNAMQELRGKPVISEFISVERQDEIIDEIQVQLMERTLYKAK